MQVHRIHDGHERMFYERNVDVVAGKLQHSLTVALRNSSAAVEHVS
jgi:hypothetical protein